MTGFAKLGAGDELRVLSSSVDGVWEWPVGSTGTLFDNWHGLVQLLLLMLLLLPNNKRRGNKRHPRVNNGDNQMGREREEQRTATRVRGGISV